MLLAVVVVGNNVVAERGDTEMRQGMKRENTVMERGDTVPPWA